MKSILGKRAVGSASKKHGGGGDPGDIRWCWIWWKKHEETLRCLHHLPSVLSISQPSAHLHSNNR
jgi:hypothetical protein